MASYPREQIFLGAEPSKSEFSPPSPRRLKPVGGFWTSTLRKNNGQVTSDWLNWVQYDYKKAYKHVDNPQVWKIIVEPSVSLLKITDDERFAEYVNKTESTRFKDECEFNIDAIFSDGFDGIWMTQKGISSGLLHSKEYDRLAAWDVESTLWIDWPVKTYEHVASLDTYL